MTSVPFNDVKLRTGPSRPDKTFADYAAIAICPALIMVMVGSLVFLLVQIGYAGPFQGRLRWTLFWFVMAMVLVSRLAMQKGPEHAALYGIALALATGCMILQFVGNILPVWCLLALIWWGANKLTWDCTLIDEDVDASGEGLLQVAGMDSNTSSADSPAPIQEAKQSQQATAAGPKKPKGPPTRMSRWRRWFVSKPERAGQPHAPGLWVIYFSLAALPIFGIGQGFIPAQDHSARQYAFVLLWCYVACALGLLLVTSFLGLRRYLRQRHLQMPVAVAGLWIPLGAAISVIILCLCVLLPRPNADWSVMAMIDRLGSPPQRASDHAVLGGPSGEGQGREIGQKNDPNQSDQTARGSPTRTERVAVPGRTIDLPTHELSNLLKWIVYGLIVLAAVWLAIRNWNQLLKVVRELWLALIQLWRGLFERTQSSPQQMRLRNKAPAYHPRPFSAFTNPFASGSAQKTPVADLVIYSFDAMQAWAAERRWERVAGQTPCEFAQRLAEQAPDLADEARQVTQLYARVAYAEQSELPECQEVLEKLWRKMTI